MRSRTPTCRSISQLLLHERTSTAGTHSVSHLPIPRLMPSSITCTSPIPLLSIHTASFRGNILRLEQDVVQVTLLRLGKYIDELYISKQPILPGLAHRAFTMNVISKYTMATSFGSLSKPNFNESLVEVDPPECQHGAYHPSFSINV